MIRKTVKFTRTTIVVEETEGELDLDENNPIPCATGWVIEHHMNLGWTLKDIDREFDVEIDE